MQFEVNDMLAEKFKAALKKSGEDETAVINRMFKTYVYDVFSRYQEDYYALEAFLTVPKDIERK